MRTLGIALLVALSSLIVYKLCVGETPELLWMCYPSAAILCAGLVLQRSFLTSLGGLFYLAVGLPFWLVGVITTGSVSLPSIAVHLIAPLAAVLHFRRVAVPPAAKYWMVPIYVGLLLASRAFTPPGLNVDLAFGPYFHVDVPVWVANLFNFVSGFLLLYAVERIVNRSSGRSARPARM